MLPSLSRYWDRKPDKGWSNAVQRVRTVQSRFSQSKQTSLHGLNPPPTRPSRTSQPHAQSGVLFDSGEDGGCHDDGANSPLVLHGESERQWHPVQDQAAAGYDSSPECQVNFTGHPRVSRSPSKPSKYTALTPLSWWESHLISSLILEPTRWPTQQQDIQSDIIVASLGITVEKRTITRWFCHAMSL